MSLCSSKICSLRGTQSKHGSSATSFSHAYDEPLNTSASVSSSDRTLFDATSSKEPSGILSG